MMPKTNIFLQGLRCSAFGLKRKGRFAQRVPDDLDNLADGRGADAIALVPERTVEPPTNNLAIYREAVAQRSRGSRTRAPSESGDNHTPPLPRSGYTTEPGVAQRTPGTQPPPTIHLP
jgi:hypothetical protein